VIIVKLQKKGVKIEVPVRSASEIRTKVREFIDNDPALKLTGFYYRD